MQETATVRYILSELKFKMGPGLFKTLLTLSIFSKSNHLRSLEKLMLKDVFSKHGIIFRI